MIEEKLELITLPAGDLIEVDMDDPGRSTICGAFRQYVKIGENTRSMITYMPEDWRQNNRCIVIAPPSDAEVTQFLVSSGLKKFADNTKVLLCVIEPANGAWNTDGSDSRFMNAAFKATQAREYYVVMQDAVYGMGFGDGAVIAHQAVLNMTSEYSGLATFGPITDEVFCASEQDVDAGTQNEEFFVSGKMAQLPVWMYVPEKTPAVEKLAEFWKITNADVEVPLFDQFGTEIYLPKPLKNTSKINDDNIAQFRLTVDTEGTTDEAKLEYVWEYVGAARRHRSYSSKVLRYFRDPMQTGATYHTMKVDGMMREWYEYVPDKCKNSAAPVPVVVVFHGRGGNGETFYDITDMSLVAQERGFIAVFPTADIYQVKKGYYRGVRLWNGEQNGKPFDSIPFVRKMIADISERWNVDESRIFAFGQSSGGHMATCCALKASDIFCAVAPCSGFTFPGFQMMGCPQGPMFEGGYPPVFFMIGKDDKFFGMVDTFKPIPENASCGQFVKYLIETYKLEEEADSYTAYPINYFVWHNENKIPILQVGLVDDMPHANYAEQSRIAYDQFFAKWRKDKEGNRYYMGRRV